MKKITQKLYFLLATYILNVAITTINCVSTKGMYNFPVPKSSNKYIK